MHEGTQPILWAEDNPQDCILINESLRQSANRNVLLVADGLLLLEALGNHRARHVVLDLKMPRLGGLETLRRIRSHPKWKTVPVTIFSSGNRPDEIAQCRALGVEAVVQKPIDYDSFATAVQQIVHSAQPRCSEESTMMVSTAYGAADGR